MQKYNWLRSVYKQFVNDNIMHFMWLKNFRILYKMGNFSQTFAKNITLDERSKIKGKTYSHINIFIVEI